MAKKGLGLGRGLEALMPETVEQAIAQGERVLNIELSRLYANPDQPRKEFRQEQLEELAASIREKGIIQPLVVEAMDDDRYMIIAGERRFRAAKLAGIPGVPAVVKRFSEEDRLEIGLIENIQREDLNAIEEALGFRSLMDQFGLTQDEVARKLGKSRSAVANALRLLRLPDEVQKSISGRQISAGHARALLSIDDERQIELKQLYSLMIDEGLSVRVSEKAARMINDGLGMEAVHQELRALRLSTEGSEGNGLESDDRLRREVLALSQGARIHKSGSPSDDASKAAQPGTRRDPEIWRIEEDLIRSLGTRVDVKGDLEKGRIEIHYYNRDDLTRLFDLLHRD